MTDNDTKLSTDDMIHSHSDLSRQIEELEAHACTLHTIDADCWSGLLDDFVDFAHRFATSTAEHIAEEEQELFPRYQDGLSAPARAVLDRIYRQHRNIETSIDKLMGYLRDAQKTDLPNSDLAESIYARTRLLRYDLRTHTSDEQLFFKKVTQNTTDSEQ